MYRDLENRPKKIKCDATNKDDALKILNDIKAKLLKDRKEIKRDSSLLHQKIMNNNLSLDDVAKLYFPTKTAKSIDMIKSAYTRLISPTLGQTKIKKLKLKI